MAQYRRIGVTQNNDVAIVSFNDKKILDEASIQELGAELFGLVEQQSMGDILLNFTNVEFLSSAALGKLITLDRKVKASKGRMKMCNIRPEIFEVFQITKLNKVFDIRKDETEAMTAPRQFSTRGLHTVTTFSIRRFENCGQEPARRSH